MLNKRFLIQVGNKLISGPHPNTRAWSCETVNKDASSFIETLGDSQVLEVIVSGAVAGQVLRVNEARS